MNIRELANEVASNFNYCSLYDFEIIVKRKANRKNVEYNQMIVEQVHKAHFGEQ